MGPTGGSIINISSVVGPMPVENASVYSASKAAIDAVTVALSKELGPKRIRVNSLNPGMIETEGLHAAGIAESDFRKTVESQTPLGRIGQPEDVARVAVFYASDDAGWVTGQTLILAGGQRQ
jgi:3-oxoacyl-[acyl-carrier protein] reductase